MSSMSPIQAYVPELAPALFPDAKPDTKEPGLFNSKDIQLFMPVGGQDRPGFQVDFLKPGGNTEAPVQRGLPAQELLQSARTGLRIESAIAANAAAKPVAALAETLKQGLPTMEAVAPFQDKVTALLSKTQPPQAEIKSAFDNGVQVLRDLQALSEKLEAIKNPAAQRALGAVRGAIDSVQQALSIVIKLGEEQQQPALQKPVTASAA
jgi:hypothetical protein